MNDQPCTPLQEANLRAILSKAREILKEDLKGASIEHSIAATNRMVEAQIFMSHRFTKKEPQPIQLGWTPTK